MNVQFELPLDQGFLRRECPSCERQFKWHHGPVEGAPELEDDLTAIYYCPYCSEPAQFDSWLTKEQVHFIEQIQEFEGAKIINDELKGLNTRGRKGAFSISVKVNPLPIPAPPTPLMEPDDMVAVSSPCHPWEPVKIVEDWTGAVHCLVCGAPYRLD